jgi:hypothetical protein
VCPHAALRRGGSRRVRPIDRTARHRLGSRDGFRERGVGIVNVEADVAHAVAVQPDVVVDRVFRRVRRGQHDAGSALLERIGGGVAAPGLEAAYANWENPKAWR